VDLARASLASRGAARFSDFVLTTTVGGLMFRAAGGREGLSSRYLGRGPVLVAILGVVIAAAYEIVLVALYGQTLGKRL
jgi:RDD family protein